MYDFQRIQHGPILTYAVLTGLTPLIPIPFVDDWVKNGFLRRMVRQIASGRGVALADAEVEALLEEDFWGGCVDGCVYAGLYLLRELFSKVFFWIKWRRAFNLVSATYYSGFLLDAALMDGALQSAETPGRLAEARRLAGAIRRARYGANLQLIQRLIRPRVMLAAAWALVRRTVREVPRMLAALPGTVWRGIRGAPGRIRENFYHRVQVLLGRERAPEIVAVQRLVQSMQESLLKIDPAHFDALHARLAEEIRRAEAESPHGPGTAGPGTAGPGASGPGSRMRPAPPAESERA